MSGLIQLFDALHGVVLPYAGTTAPDGFLLCHGQEVDREEYAVLFAVIGTTYGEGDGSTTFNVPDLRGRVIAGKDDMGGSAASRLGVTLSGTRGSTANGVITGISSTAGLAIGMKAFGDGIGEGAVISAINSATQVTLSVSNTETGTGDIRFGMVDGVTLGDAGGEQSHTLTIPEMPAHNHTVANTGRGSGTAYDQGSNYDSTATRTSNTVGGGNAHNNVQPTIVLNYIIKT